MKSSSFINDRKFKAFSFKRQSEPDQAHEGTDDAKIQLATELARLHSDQHVSLGYHIHWLMSMRIEK